MSSITITLSRQNLQRVEKLAESYGGDRERVISDALDLLLGGTANKRDQPKTSAASSKGKASGGKE